MLNNFTKAKQKLKTAPNQQERFNSSWIYINEPAYGYTQIYKKSVFKINNCK